MIFVKDNTPRWIIVTIDTGICLFSLLVAYLLRFNFTIPAEYFDTFYYLFPLVLGLRILSFFIFGTYRGIIRYTSTIDTQRIFLVVTSVTTILILLNSIRYFFIDDFFIIPFSVVVIEFMTTIVLMISFRITVKLIYFEFKTASKEKIKVVIFGAGEAGIITKRTLSRDQETRYQVIAFIDHKKAIQGKKVEGVEIYAPEKLQKILEKNEIDQVILSVQNIPKAIKQEIVETSLPFKVRVLHLPPVKSWVKGELSLSQLQQVRIEDLLGREPIHLDTVNIKNQIAQKRVLITGAAGSIGSEIVRQVSDYFPSNLIIVKLQLQMFRIMPE